jgi:hypothetical protein
MESFKSSTIPVDSFLLKISEKHLRIFEGHQISSFKYQNVIAPICHYFCLIRKKFVTDRVGRAIALNEGLVSFTSKGFREDEAILPKDGNYFNCLIDNLDVKPICFSTFISERSKNKTGFRGVFADLKNNRYRSEIYFMGERIRLGRYRTAHAAHEAYKAKAIELYGDYAIRLFNS